MFFKVVHSNMSQGRKDTSELSREAHKQKTLHSQPSQFSFFGSKKLKNSTKAERMLATMDVKR